MWVEENAYQSKHALKSNFFDSSNIIYFPSPHCLLERFEIKFVYYAGKIT